MTLDITVVSWDGQNINDGTNYRAGLVNALGLPTAQPNMIERLQKPPVLAGLRRPARKLTLLLTLLGDLSEQRQEVEGWFDSDDETSKRLIISDSDGGNQRYVMALCDTFDVMKGSDGRQFIASLAVDGDLCWRSVLADTETWEIEASGETITVENNGSAEAYPKFTITPTDGKSGGYSYRKFVPWRWTCDVPYTRYPLDVADASLDTETLIDDGKMQADGDDLRVLVNGVEVDRWLSGIDTAATRVWCNLTFQPRWDGTLKTAISDTGTVETIDVNEAITGAPAFGILIIESAGGWEAFTYTGKNDSLRRFTGVTPAAKNTARLEHAENDEIWLCQHDLWIVYGNSSATAPTTDDDYKPAFDLDSSTNASWVYETFGADGGLRSGQWGFVELSLAYPPYGSTFYGGNRGAAADPWEEIGILGVSLARGMVWIVNPCGISNANFANGEKFAHTLSWNAATGLYSSANGSTWVLEAAIAAPAVADTWEAWSKNEALAAGSVGVGLELRIGGAGLDVADVGYLEAADCTLTIDDPPVGLLDGGEDGSYSLDCTLMNNTAEKSIQVTYTMAVDQSIEVDTDQKSVTDLADNSSQFQAFALREGPRRDWLPLLPGENELEFIDVGTAGVTVVIEWEERRY